MQREASRTATTCGVLRASTKAVSGRLLTERHGLLHKAARTGIVDVLALLVHPLEQHLEDRRNRLLVPFRIRLVKLAQVDAERRRRRVRVVRLEDDRLGLEWAGPARRVYSAAVHDFVKQSSLVPDERFDRSKPQRRTPTHLLRSMIALRSFSGLTSSSDCPTRCKLPSTSFGSAEIAW